MTLDPLIFPPTLRAPQPHQLEAYELSKDRETFALFMEQRTRKTLIAVKTALYQYHQGHIGAALIILWPNGGQHEWARNWPLDWPADVPYRLLAWRSGRMGKVQRSGKFSNPQLQELLVPDRFNVLILNCEALLTELAWNLVGKFLRAHRCLVVADESSWAKSPGSARTKRLLAIGRHPNAAYRRLLDGTPAAEGSLDLWAPCAFLDWRLLGHKSYFTFRNRYAVMTTGYAPGGREFRAQATDPATGTKLYQNLDELRANLAEFSFRVLRSQVSSAPPPEYSEVFFELTLKQRRVYDRLDHEYEAEKRAGTFPVALALTRYLRLQMISRNYMPPETIGVTCPVCKGWSVNALREYIGPNTKVKDKAHCETCEDTGIIPTRTELERIDDANPALEALVARASLVTGQLVVWCRFRQDCSDVVEALNRTGHNAAKYDGSVATADRQAVYDAFRAGALDTLVATTGSGISRGHDLSCAGTVGYYSNSYVLRDRLQSQDRTESLDRTVATEVFDLIGLDTRDLPIVTALRAKQSVAALLQGDLNIQQPSS